MELVFQENQMEYLEQTLFETVTQEETTEIIVPDSFPDVNRVVDSFGTVILREKEVSPGCVNLSGGVKAGVLFVPEGSAQPQLLEAYLPFTVRKEHDAIHQDARVQCVCRIKEIDARMLNSRKVLLRASLSCRVVVYDKRQAVLYDAEQENSDLCLKRATVPMTVAVETGEKTFTINDELDLPDGTPAVDRVLKALYRVEVTDKKMIGNKAVFKGDLHIHTLYLGMDDSCNVYEGVLPFSQYVELGQELDEHEVALDMVFTGAEIEPDGQLECHRLLVALNLLVQCTVTSTQQLTYIEDAYALTQSLEPQWQTERITAQLDAEEFADTLQAPLSVSAKSVLDAWCYAADVMQQRNGERTALQYGVCCNVLYYDENGDLQGKIVRVNKTVDMALSSAAYCRPVTQITGALTTRSGGDAEVKCPVVTKAMCFAQQEFRGICGGAMQPLAPEPERPSVILRLVGQDESLWSVAKSYRTTVDNILQANDLTAEQRVGEQMLLIPM